MNEFILELDKNSTRPICRLDNNLSALIDTGADIPLCSDSETLKEFYKARLIKHCNQDEAPKGVSESLPSDLYDVEIFRLGDIIYPHLRVFVPYKAVFTTDFIISVSMLYDLTCSFDFSSHTLKVIIPDGQNNIRNAKYDKEGNSFILTSKL